MVIASRRSGIPRSTRIARSGLPGLGETGSLSGPAPPCTGNGNQHARLLPRIAGKVSGTPLRLSRASFDSHFRWIFRSARRGAGQRLDHVRSLPRRTGCQTAWSSRLSRFGRHPSAARRFSASLANAFCHAVNHATCLQASQAAAAHACNADACAVRRPCLGLRGQVGWLSHGGHDRTRKVTLYSRNGKIISDSYLPVAKALEKVKADAVLDGELVALDTHSVSRFQLLQNALRAEAKLLYCIFDMMFCEGEDLRGLRLLERKDRLRRVLPSHSLLSFSEHRPEHGVRYFKEAEKQGLEGIMAKRADSLYLSGARSSDWLKIKTAHRQEVVIAGFTAPRRSRPYFGSLVLAVREGDEWRYVGHVGTGFSHATLKELHGILWRLRTNSSPFRHRVKDEAVTTWVSPNSWPRSNSRNGPRPARCAILCTWVCARTNGQRTWSERRKRRASTAPGVASHETTAPGSTSSH